MFKWKSFIQGPGLFCEKISYEKGKRKKETIDLANGLNTAEFYKEVLSSKPSSSVSSYTRSRILEKSTKSKKEPKQIPTLSQLMRHCESDNVKELKRLHEDGCIENINAQDEFGWTVLMCAAAAGALESTQLLLQIGADLEISDKGNLTALDLAKRKKRYKIAEFLQEWTKKAKTKSRDDSGTSNISSSNIIPEPFYCEKCQNQYTDKFKHLNSISHQFVSNEKGAEKAHYGIPESNVGFQLMLQSGWDRDKGLGPDESGQKYPVKTLLKRDRKGFGSNGEAKPRVTHFGPFDITAVEGIRRSKRMEKPIVLKKKDRHKKITKEMRKTINLRQEFS